MCGRPDQQACYYNLGRELGVIPGSGTWPHSDPREVSSVIPQGTQEGNKNRNTFHGFI